MSALVLAGWAIPALLITDGRENFSPELASAVDDAFGMTALCFQNPLSRPAGVMVRIVALELYETESAPTTPWQGLALQPGGQSYRYDATFRTFGPFALPTGYIRIDSAQSLDCNARRGRRV